MSTRKYHTNTNTNTKRRIRTKYRKKSCKKRKLHKGGSTMVNLFSHYFGGPGYIAYT
jgi:hypothetical protein